MSLAILVVLSMGVHEVSAQKVPVDLYGDRLPKHAVGRLGTSRFRPQAETIERISWSPDGKFLATLASHAIGANDPGIEIWDSSTQLAVGPRKLVHRVIHAMAWSPDSGQLAVCPDSGSVEVWDVRRNKLIQEFSLEYAPFHCVDWSSNGKWIAAGRREDGVVILDAVSMKIEDNFDQPARSLDFSADSKWLATCIDNRVNIWKLSKGKLRYEIDLKPDTPEPRLSGTFYIEMSPVGRSLVVTGDRTSVIDFSGKQPRTHLLRTDTGEPLDSFGVSFKPDGSQFVTTAFSSALLWDTGTRELLRDYPDETGFAVDFSPDGESLAFALGRLAVVDVATGLDRNPRAAHRRVVLNSAFSPDGQSAYTIETGPTIRKWDTQSTRQISKLRLPDENARVIGILGDGKLVVIGTENLIYFVDSDTLEISGEPIEHQGLTSVVFSPTDDLAVLRSNDGTAKFINPVTRETVASVNLELSNCHMGYSVFTQDGARLALVSPLQSRIDILDSRTRKTLRTIRIDEQMVSLYMPACFLPDGKSLACLTVSPDPNVESWVHYHIDIQDVLTGDRIRRLKGKFEYPTAIACSPQADLIAVADHVKHESGKTPSLSRIIRVYSTTTGKRLVSLNGHKSNIRNLQFSPNGTSLYSTSQDTNVLIWDMTSARASIPKN